MPKTLDLNKIKLLEKQPVIANNPKFESYVAVLKEAATLEIRMTLEEKKMLEQIFNVAVEEKSSEQAEPEEYLTVRDVAKLLGISPQMVRRHCANNNIVSWRTAGEKGEWRIDIDQYRSNPSYSKRLETVLDQVRNRKERKQNLISAVKELPQTNGYTEMLDDINARHKGNDTD
ncbi:helix-turn-helix domain-containing protein [Priestia megaterium]|uniref:helix-turn-helix domain-containing protein n=1 Tax=Priestia megaterium TaxID=1404 RepID=UPI002E223D43|nr:helix-turn-helix domain-containing protein [Priestia megaterium]